MPQHIVEEIKEIRREVDESKPYLNQWADAKDTENKWYEAQIKDIDEKELKVLIHYKGFPAKWDEWLPFTSDRLCKLHTHTKPLVPSQASKVQCRVGTQLDTMDAIDNWCRSEIISINPLSQQIHIKYLDWDAKYNEWINIDSYRFAPLHTYTQPKQRSSQQKIHTSDNEEIKYRETLDKFNMKVIDMATDGNCLFRTVSHQVYGTPEYHAVVRAKCMEYVESQAGFFRGYVDEELPHYIERMKYDGEWGGEVEIRAMGEIYQRPIEIYVYSADPKRVYRGPNPRAYPIRLSYHWNSHYNSLIANNGPRDHFITAPAGEAEDRSIQMGRKLEVELSPEEKETRRALEDSRREFDSRDLDAALSQAFLADVEAAKQASLLALDEKQDEAQVLSDIDRALLNSLQEESMMSSEQEQLERAKLLSTQEYKDIDSDMMKATRESAQIYDEKMNVSKDGIHPQVLQACRDMGFSEEAIMTAYCIIASSNIHLSNDELTTNLVTFLSNQKNSNT